MAEKPWANGHDLSKPDRSALVGQGDPGNADHRKQHAPTFNCPGVPRRWTAQAEGQDNLQGIVPPDRLEKVEQPVARSPGGGTAGRAPGKAKARPGTRPDSPTQGRRTTGGTSVLSKKRVLHTQGSARQHLGGEVRDCRCEYALKESMLALYQDSCTEFTPEANSQRAGGRPHQGERPQSDRWRR